MPQQSLFEFGQCDEEAHRVNIPDAALSIYRQAFSATEADSYLNSLVDTTPWRHDNIKIHGKTFPLPRLQTWYAHAGATLRYSGMRIKPLAWTNELLSIGDRVEALTGLRFDGVLVNLYRDGNDSVGWHSDNEVEFGPDPVIASVSFGATRDFVLKHLFKVELKPVKCALTHGSLLVMGHGVQTHWQHQLPKRKRVTEPRVNLTFRNIFQP